MKEKKCTPCQSCASVMSIEEINRSFSKLKAGWKVIDDHHLQKTYTFPDFKEALKFTNKIGSIAETEGHHPDIYLSWGKVTVSIWTHKVNSLTESDFILAEKIDESKT